MLKNNLTKIWGYRSTSTYLKKNTGCHARENPSEETVSESSQIRAEVTYNKHLNKEVTFNYASSSKSIYIDNHMQPRQYTEQTTA